MKVTSSKIKSNIRYTVILLTTLIFWGSGMYYGQFIKNNYQSVSIRIHGEGVPLRTIERAVDNEVMKDANRIPTVTAWNCLIDQQVKNTVLSTTAKTRLLEVCGDMSQVYPMELVSGIIPVKDDSNGCLLDRNTAYELFQSSDVIGNILTYQEKEYCIRGIIDTEERLIIIPKVGSNHSYLNLELVYEDKENGEQLANEFIVQNALASSYTVLDACFYSEIIGLFYLFPAWILGLYLLFIMLKSIWERRTLPIQLIVYLIIFLVAWEGIRWVMDFQLSLPDRLIPTRWSDFDFWTRKYREQLEHWKDFAYLIPLPKDIFFFRFARRCVFYSLISTATSMFYIAHRKKLMKDCNLLYSVIVCFLLEGVAVLILYYAGRIFTITRGYLFMLPLFLIVITIRTKYSKIRR